MKIFLIDNGTTLLTKLHRLIPGHEITQSWANFDVEEALRSDIVVLSGGSICSLTGNEDRYATELAFIKQTTKSVIGICFGCELVVAGFGGTLKELPAHSRGTVHIDVVNDGSLFGGRKSFEAYENHSWIANVLPPDLEVLARSAHGPEVVRHRSRPIYGLQFHPEHHVEEMFGDEVFLNILKRCNKDRSK